SRLLELGEVAALAARFDPATLTYRWPHPDPRVDRLQADVSALVGVRLTSDRGTTFDAVRALDYERAARPPDPMRARAQTRPLRDRATVPYLNEPWYCCAEP